MPALLIRPRPSLLYPFLVFIFFASLTLTISWSLYQYRQNLRENEFNDQSFAVKEEIDRHYRPHARTLRGLCGLFAASEEVTREEFATHVSYIAPDPTIVSDPILATLFSVTYSERVPAENVPAFLESLAEEGYPVSPILADLAGECFFIKYHVGFAPFGERPLGGDLCTQPQIAQAISLARDSGDLTITPLIDLGRGTRGLMLTAPVYDNALPIATVEDRRLALVGVLSSSFPAADFFATIFAAYTTPAGINVLVSDQDGAMLHATADPPADPVYQAQLSLPVAGRTWTVSVFADTTFISARTEIWIPIFVLISGSLVTVLLTWTTYLLVSSRERAISTAEKMTRELRLSQAKFQKLFDEAPIAYNLVSPDGRITAVNQATATFLGYSIEELLGQSVFFFQPDQHQDQTKAAFQKLIHAGAISKEILPFKHKDGTLRWGQLSARALYNEKGEIVEILTAITDISTQRQLETELQNRAGQLESLNRVMVGRELKMIELKDEIAYLQKQLSAPK